jgi:hypothetical protein
MSAALSSAADRALSRPYPDARRERSTHSSMAGMRERQACWLVLAALVLAGCLHVETSGPATISGIGELYLCDAVIHDGPTLERERWCDLPFDPVGARDRFEDELGQAGMTVAAVACVGAGSREVGGTGIAIPCLLD